MKKLANLPDQDICVNAVPNTVNVVRMIKIFILANKISKLYRGINYEN